jgi:hypothetical protein
MNAIALFLTLVLQGNPTCPAVAPNETAVETTTGAERVHVQVYECFWCGGSALRISSSSSRRSVPRMWPNRFSSKKSMNEKAGS